jgi:hypothetical protein
MMEFCVKPLDSSDGNQYLPCMEVSSPAVSANLSASSFAVRGSTGLRLKILGMTERARLRGFDVSTFACGGGALANDPPVDGLGAKVGLPTEARSLAETGPPSRFALWRATFARIHERRLVDQTGIEPVTS